MTHNQKLIRLPLAVLAVGTLLGSACASDDDGVDDPSDVDVDVDNPIDDPVTTLDDSNDMGSVTPTSVGG
jgi:hypothetical protein